MDSFNYHFKENHYITIEFEQVLLNVHYKYESALSRYEFDGPIIYMNHQHKESVDSLENLLGILVTDFHIDIPFHLKVNLFIAEIVSLKYIKNLIHVMSIFKDMINI